uniref:Putative ribonuclease H-like domain-containing protein n=1 Tax=Tanacetum cinerariifolium TaxID=118510 RepID=A0A6L2NNM6_TANCI|nr:putative ribonuclease H-like domain-containing protein [Tanacetum cinerariifolium]
MQEELLQFKMQKVWVLVDLPHGKRAIGTKWVYRNKKDERGILIRNKARLVVQGHIQDEGIDYKEVFASVARIAAIRLFLAYASFMGFMVYQMDVKNAFLYGTIEEEVYVCQPLGFEDPNHPEKVYKVVKALYGLNQAPRAWYETLLTYLLANDDIIFDATNKDLCKSFEKLMKDKFQMSSMGELTFFLGLQVKENKDGIFISQDKYVAEILRKFGLTEGKSASTPIDTEKPLLKDPDGKDVDVHTYRSMIGSLMYLTSSRLDIMFSVCVCAHFQVTPKASHLHAVKRIFRYLKGKPHLGLWYPKDLPFDLVAYSDRDYAGASLNKKSTTGGCQILGCKLISWQCKKQTVVATSSTEAEYVAAASCCAQDVLSGIDSLKKMLHVSYLLSAGYLTSQQMVLNSPWQTTTGKEILNPFMVGSLPKTIVTTFIQINDVTRLQALVDKKKVVITEAAIREVLRLDDVEGVNCLPNEEIFAELARMGYEKPSTKLTFYKAFFSSQLVRNVDSTSKFYMYPHFIQLLIKKQLEHVEVDTAAQGDDTTAQGDDAQEPSIPSLTPRTLPPQQPQDLPSTSQKIDTSEDTIMDDASNHGRIIDEMGKDDVVALMDNKEKNKKEEEAKEVVDVVTTAKLNTEVVTDANETVTAASTTIFAAKPQVTAATITAAPVRVAVASTRRRKGVAIRDPEEESTTSSIISADTKSKDKGKGIMVEEPKPLKKKQQVEIDEEYARKLHVELNKDIDWDTTIDHVKLDYFKGMSYDDIRPIFEAKFNSNIDFLLKTNEQMEEDENRSIQSINETPAQKAANGRKLNEEVEDLKRHLDIVPDEDDDVYTEATPLARNVPIVDYEIIHLNNKSHYKIIRADRTHRLYVSFLTLLKNFDREDLESLWSLVKERFSTSKPNNFSDDFLLTTLGAMFERPDGQAQV